MRRAAGLLAGAAALVVLFLLLSPPVGAGLRVVAVEGSSMTPALRPGDLAIVAPKESYLPGQVVAYRSPDLGAVLVHRVVGYEGERLVLKGDANGFVDSYRPAPSDVLGAMVARAPGVGKAILLLMEPQAAGAAAGGATAAMIALGSRRRRPLLLSPPFVLYGLGAGLLLLATGAAGILAQEALPPTERARTPIAYVHQGEWSYEAPSLAPVYQGGATARTGEPLFLRLVRPVTFTFRYQAPAEVQDPRGSITLSATVGDYSPSGWRRTIPLAGPTPFHGSEAAVTGTLDLAEATRVWQEVAQAAGLPMQAARLQVTAQVHLEGELGGGPFVDDASFSLPFRLDQAQAALEPPPDGQLQPLLAPTLDRTVVMTTERPRQVGIGALRMPLREAGRISLYLLWAGGGLVAVTALAVLLALRSPAGLAALLGAQVVRAQGLLQEHEGVVLVEGIGDLVKAARAASSPVTAYPDGTLAAHAGGATYLWRPRQEGRRGLTPARREGVRA